MKIFKKSAVIIAAAILSLLFVFSASAAGEGISNLSVSFDAGESNVSVNWWQGNGQYYLFLPSDADADSLTLNFKASSDVTLDGKKIVNGAAVKLEAESTYKLSCDGKEYTLYVLKSEGLPSLHIATESGSMKAVHADKDHKEAADITIVADGKAVFNNEKLEYIKGRGNSTWSMEKKPYNIKFEEKYDLFGMGKAKKWTLLANYTDETDIRNIVAFGLAEEIGLHYTSKGVSVDLYINGDYYGNYLLCESVEVGETRVDIADLEKATEKVNSKDLDAYSPGGAQVSIYSWLVSGTQKWVNIPNNPENITGGYLLEYEATYRYVNEVSGFVTKNHQCIVVKAPEYASEAQVKYISALYQEFEDAVYSADGYNSKGKHYTEYIDVESFVRMYLFQEYVKNIDAALTSFYIVKDADSDVFVASPVWDFDYALGNDHAAQGSNINKPDEWWSAGLFYNSRNDERCLPAILSLLFKQDDFAALAADEWNNAFAPVLDEEFFSSITDTAEKITDSAVMNAIRWKVFGTSDYQSTAAKYTKNVEKTLVDFLVARKAFLDKGFSENSVRVFFDGNGGTGNMFNRVAVMVGESYTLPEPSYTMSGYEFAGWSTAPDGSDGIYEAGSKVTLESKKVTFYAQWEESKLLSGFQKFIQSIRDFFNKIRDFFINLFN